VQVPKNLNSAVTVPDGQDWSVGFEPAMGALVSIPIDFDPEPLDGYWVDTARNSGHRLRLTISRSGRPQVCSPAGTTLGAPACS
jgi:hypothetical protein